MRFLGTGTSTVIIFVLYNTLHKAGIQYDLKKLYLMLFVKGGLCARMNTDVLSLYKYSSLPLFLFLIET